MTLWACRNCDTVADLPQGPSEGELDDDFNPPTRTIKGQMCVACDESRRWRLVQVGRIPAAEASK